MTAKSSTDQEDALVRQSRGDEVAALETTVVPYDENLLERVRIQWQFGDWQSLCKLSREAIQHHPDRAKLALLAAASRLQTGYDAEARQYIRLAQDWGVGRKLLSRILISGVHNSLGCAAAVGNQPQRALQHFEKALVVGTPSADTRLMMRARASEQFSKLGLKFPENSDESLDTKFKRNSRIPFSVGQLYSPPPISIDMFFSEREGDRARSLENVKKRLDKINDTETFPELTWVSVEHRSNTFFFTHFSGDYIPAKMAEKSQFYESLFLNLLARLHQPGKVIVDGGANIGNHTIFFAGVIGAPVIAFEPQPFNHSFLITNICLNCLDEKVDVRKVALGDHVGHISLFQALPGNFGSFTADMALVKQKDGDDYFVTPFDVQVSTLDVELADFEEAISIIKLDLEGMELDALRGARRVIAKSLPVIAVECFTLSMFQEINALLKAFGYFVIDSANATPTFIFLTRRNLHHVEMLSKYLEMSSVGKFSSNSSFNEKAS
ncbi:methyltransferase, FkbM family [Desulfomicrobium apsheronum]|uniref:Methyltransferase, FkbM family n=1 Tax=Desulfomicrobium apsheronum TaxID=52560 RepID=A0A1I3SX83_9BACT|nr:FkbM family methyltransferase [Desulfomicrobium apsheronum]SFJ63458.1 methyltransferase, FkbM family [Desulfomicrobium apsheronum]